MNPANKKYLEIFVPFSIILTAFAILFCNTIENLFQDWMTNDNFSHGILIPFIAGYMIWQKKSELEKIPVMSSNVGLMVIIFGMIVFIIGNIGAELFTMRSAIVITIIGFCVYAYGVQVAIVIAVPLAYLMFMIPLPAIIWNKIAFPLQLLAAKLSSNVVQLLGIPLLREGNVLHLPNTTLEVVDACSGLRSLTTLIALSAAFAYIVKLTNISKGVLFLSAIPIAIFVNIVRLTLTALLATYIGPETAHGFLHDMSGLAVFIIAFLLMYVVYIGLHKVEQKNRSLS